MKYFIEGFGYGLMAYGAVVLGTAIVYIGKEVYDYRRGNK